jgi:hypothetical protein
MTIPGIGGAPLKYTPEEFSAKIVEYFKYVDEENKNRRLKRFTEDKIKPYTITGICVYLDISRETWREYSERAEFAETIKRVKTIVGNYIEEGLLNGSINAIGGIFNLKNNFGWVDKTEFVVKPENDKISADDIRKRIEERKRLQICE